MKTLLYRVSSLFFVFVAVNGCKEKIPNAVSIEFGETSGTHITEFTVNLASAITKSGSQEISDHGFAFSATTETPDINSGSIKKGAVDIATPTPISFNGTLSGLEPATEYYIRPYAVTAQATHFGKVLKVKTLNITQPAIKTDGSEAVTHSSAKLNGSISTKGTHPVSEYGLVWSESANPATSVTTKYSVRNNVSSFPVSFNTTAANLASNTTYNFRAYLISNGVTSYGANMTFKTTSLVQPGIRTDESKPASTEAYVVGTLTSAGSEPISEYGFCWGTSANPLTTGSKQAFTGNVTVFPKKLEATIRNLNPGVIYYYRAYVIMNGVTTYGENKSFTTGVDSPSLTSRAAASISTVSATVNATVNSQGSFPLSEIGIVWGTTNNPTIANNKQSKSANGVSYPHSYSFNLTALAQNTTYYFRAYTLVNGNAVYGNTLSFKTLTFQAATVSTLTTRTNVQNQGYRVNGSVSSGTYRIVRYGFYYNNIPGSGFDLLQSKEVSNRPGTPLTGTNTYNLIIPFYPCGNTVKYRAYAVDEGGNWIYGNVIQFSTSGCVN